MPVGKKPIALQPRELIGCLRRIGIVIGAIKVSGKRVYRDTQAVEIEMRVARLHRIPGPFNVGPSFRKRPFTLRPLQTRSNTQILIVPCYGHHVRITKNLIIRPDSSQMMNKTHQAVTGKSTKRPSTSLPRNDQMSARRDLKIRETKHFTLKINTIIKLADCLALANYRLLHPLRLSLQWAWWQLNCRFDTFGITISNRHTAAN